ncbi:MAG: tRNA epoxyqueuosine(34) reductase QueG [Chloroflexi bacterium]|nr:tRNA epoxyqueuosine(34) reductase QueG [Chloroflexota bacterium]
MSQKLLKKIKDVAKEEGFILAGITSPKAPPHISTYLDWIDAGRHAAMGYLADDRARKRRANPRLILPEAESILVLAAPYPDPKFAEASEKDSLHGQISAYAWEDDYHLTLKEKLQNIVAFIESEVGHPIPNRWYTDTGPILERDLAQRAGLGWIGKNTCLIHPKIGSYFFLAEILLGIKLPIDEPFTADHCGTCTRCLDACPTQAILPKRTIDANLCISYLTIENKGEIPEELRPKLGNLVFGCDICQEVCPWNQKPDRSSRPVRFGIKIDPHPNLIAELSLTPQEFNKKFKKKPVKRAKRRGYLRNIAVALGNAGDPVAIPALEKALDDIEPLVRDHAKWALNKIKLKGK